MKRESILSFLLRHGERGEASFHMPGHKGEEIYRENGFGDFLDRLMACDITEISGADNLFQAEGIIEETMERYRRLYDAEASYLLINGSSAGLIAAVMASVSDGGKLIMARNCHKSIFNSLLLSGAEPVYAYPEVIGQYGISGEITAEEIRRCLEENPDAEAVILPSPNYYGICSDIRAIGEEVHRAEKILIVDQAHGAHLKFFDRYIGGEMKAAENLGADVVINSIHKTLASFTQTAEVNLCSKRVDRYVFEDKLQLIESTSPSYLLMASLDVNASLMEAKGEELIRRWEENLNRFYREAAEIPGLQIMRHPMLDHTKINLDMSRRGIDGAELEQLLMKKGIFAELTTGNILMCMTGIGNKRSDFDRLLSALREISAERPEAAVSDAVITESFPAAGMLEQRAVPMKKERIPIEEAEGRVCASSVIPYPPGIPLVCPGEVFDREVVCYAQKLRARGEKVMGIDDRGRVVVGEER